MAWAVPAHREDSCLSRMHTLGTAEGSFGAVLGTLLTWMRLLGTQLTRLWVILGSKEDSEG